jgi:ribosomal protein L20A (L18A)
MKRIMHKRRIRYGGLMAKFLVTGSIGAGKGSKPFEKVVEAKSEKLAREYALSLLGSNAGIKRSKVKIISAEKV